MKAMPDFFVACLVSSAIQNIPRVACPKQCHQNSQNSESFFFPGKVMEIVMFNNEATMVPSPTPHPTKTILPCNQAHSNKQ